MKVRRTSKWLQLSLKFFVIRYFVFFGVFACERVSATSLQQKLSERLEGKLRSRRQRRLRVKAEKLDPLWCTSTAGYPHRLERPRVLEKM